ncbi:MAG: flagellar basal body protein [Rhodospirillaceae bacterium]
MITRSFDRKREYAVMAAPTLSSIAVSGLNAGATRAQVTANNVVNANTPGFRPARVETMTLVAGRGIDGGAGVQAQLLEGTEPGVDLVTEFTQLIASKVTYKASAELICTGLELDEALLRAVK